MKTFLNILLILIAISLILTAILNSDPIESKCISCGAALACLGACFTKKRYRYIFVGAALVLIAISFFLV